MIVADTHALVWALENSSRLGANARRQLDEAMAADALAVSAISFWEIALLVAKGRLELAEPIESWRRRLLDAGLRELPVDGAIGIQSVVLDGLHPDPADRLIVATAWVRGATLLTADRRLLEWTSTLARIDASH